jgi:hypothetical protein
MVAIHGVCMIPIAPGPHDTGPQCTAQEHKHMATCLAALHCGSGAHAFKCRFGVLTLPCAHLYSTLETLTTGRMPTVGCASQSRQSRLGCTRQVPSGPSHCAAKACALHPAGRRQERHHLRGDLVFGLCTGPFCLLHRIFLGDSDPLIRCCASTHSGSWAHASAICERCRSQWRLLASLVVGKRPRVSQEPPLHPPSPPPLPFVVRSRRMADGRRALPSERGRIPVASRISAVRGEYQRPPGFPGCS